ncbi:hypothetical protein HDU97_001714 [Phlyctochytrium planicorne]|nr:hypothetical protein HDU97_001714 [Phlyctochytrium planicorne]
MGIDVINSRRMVDSTARSTAAKIVPAQTKLDREESPVNVKVKIRRETSKGHLESPSEQLQIREQLQDDIAEMKEQYEKYVAKLVDEKAMMRVSDFAIPHRQFSSFVSTNPFKEVYQGLRNLGGSSVAIEEAIDYSIANDFMPARANSLSYIPIRFCQENGKAKHLSQLQAGKSALKAILALNASKEVIREIVAVTDANTILVVDAFKLGHMGVINEFQLQKQRLRYDPLIAFDENAVKWQIKICEEEQRLAGMPGSGSSKRKKVQRRTSKYAKDSSSDSGDTESSSDQE